MRYVQTEAVRERARKEELNLSLARLTVYAMLVRTYTSWLDSHACERASGDNCFFAKLAGSQQAGKSSVWREGGREGGEATLPGGTAAAAAKTFSHFPKSNCGENERG